MLKLFKGILILSLCASTCWSGAYAIGVSANSAIVIEKNSGRVLQSKNSESQMGMASTTKIMTALTAIENGDLNAAVKVSPNAAGVEGSSMYLEAGEEITLENLIYGLMLASGNDAATAIAEHISGSVEKFAELMNKNAEEIGVKNTHFDNPHGLSSDAHYTTAHDLALITARALNNPKFREVVSTKSKKIPWQGKNYDRQLANHNKFLSMYGGCIGVKTGFTKATGRCLVTAVERDNMTLICVTLNAPDDWNDHKIMYDASFGEYEAYKLMDKNYEFGKLDVKNAENTDVCAVAAEDFYFPIKKGGETPVFRCELYDNLTAPVKADQPVGEIYAKLNNEEFFMGYAYPQNDILEKKINLGDMKIIPDFKFITIQIFKSWLDVFKR